VESSGENCGRNCADEWEERKKATNARRARTDRGMMKLNGNGFVRIEGRGRRVYRGE